MLATIIILQSAKILKIVSFPNYTNEVPKKVNDNLVVRHFNFDLVQVFPLPLLYFGNLVCGLGGTKHLSLPMFTVLRRFTILMTVIAEYIVLKYGIDYMELN